jgi:hypothetical protein
MRPLSIYRFFLDTCLESLKNITKNVKIAHALDEI